MSMEIKDEVAEMNSVFDQILTSPKEEPAKDEPKVEEPKAEEPKVEPETGPEPPIEPVVEPEQEPKVEKESEPVVTEDLTSTVEALRLEIAELKAKKAEAPPKEEPVIQPVVPEIAEQDFIGNLDFDELTRDPKEFNKVLNNIYKKARTDTEQAFIAQLPSVVNSQVAAVSAMQRAVEDFYAANEDLKPFKKVVQTVWGEVSATDPNRTLEDVMSEVAKDTRKRLGLSEPKPKEVKPEVKDTKPSVPRLPSKGASAGKPSDDKPNILQSELEAMTKVIRS